MGLLKIAKGLIGIDIASSAIKLVELKKSHDCYQIDGYAISPLRQGAVVERRLYDVNHIVDALRCAIDKAKPFSRQAAVAVPASATITKELSLPASLNEYEIEERIAVDSDQHACFPFSDAAFDYQRLGPTALNSHQQRVRLVVCRQQAVTQLCEIVERAGLEPVAVDVDSNALQRCLEALHPQPPTADDLTLCLGVLDIGACTCAFHVLHGEQLLYSSDTPLGGYQLTNAIGDYYAMNLEEADIAKQHGGLPDSYPAKVLTPFLTTLVQQVSRSLQLYYAAGGQPRIQRLILTGGSSAIVGLAERLAEALGMPVTLANPFQHMRVHKRLDGQALAAQASAMLTASGLAMRGWP